MLRETFEEVCGRGPASEVRRRSEEGLLGSLPPVLPCVACAVAGREQRPSHEPRSRAAPVYCLVPQVFIETVDSFQGKQLDVVILSCVRASTGGGLGFVNDIRRMNVRGLAWGALGGGYVLVWPAVEARLRAGSHAAPSHHNLPCSSPPHTHPLLCLSSSLPHRWPSPEPSAPSGCSAPLPRCEPTASGRRSSSE